MIDASGLRSLAAIAGEGGTEQDELAFLKAKAKDSKHWTLMSSTLLEEARFEMHHVGLSTRSQSIGRALTSSLAWGLC